jgi:uncharacterized surface protein with fasciclin (FAS1) repeats
MRRLSDILLAAALPLAIPTPAAAQCSQGTIVDIVLEASGGASAGTFDADRTDYDLLVRALQTADLVAALQGPGPLTVFAPNDAAFVRLARDLGFTGSDEAGTWQFLVDTLTQLGGGDPIPTLTNILLYHVSPGRVRVRDVLIATLRCRRIPTLLSGATIRPFFVRLIDNEPDLRNPTLIAPLDLRASNGVIHGINRVLIPVDLP